MYIICTVGRFLTDDTGGERFETSGRACFHMKKSYLDIITNLRSSGGRYDRLETPRARFLRLIETESKKTRGMVWKILLGEMVAVVIKKIVFFYI